MKQVIIILIGLLLAINSVFSQSDFREGYIIASSNDTIYGLIDYRGSKSNAKKCVFIKLDDTEYKKIEYTPNDIIAYRFIDSKYYVSRKVNVEGKDELLFLEYLINGIVNIFFYCDNIGNWHYYIEKGTGKLVELQNNKIVTYRGNYEYTSESKRYIGVLSYLFQDAPNISKEAEKIDLNHNSLIKIGRDYHNAVCENEACIVYEKEIPSVIIDFGPLLGINYNSRYILNENYVDANKFNSVSPSIGMFIKLGIPSINERLFFQFDLSYSRPSFTAENSIAYFMNYYNSIAVTFNSIDNVGMIRYEFPTGKLRPVLELGGFYNYIFQTDYSRELDVKWGKNETHYSFNDNPFAHYDYGIGIGLGGIYQIFKDKKIFINLRYKKGFVLLKNNTSLSIGIPF